MLPDYLPQYASKIEADAILQLRQERQAWLERPSCAHFKEAYDTLGHESFQTTHTLYDQDVVTLGEPGRLDSEQQDTLNQALKTLIPWRKGPFQIFDTYIDSEWRSDWKWNRVFPEVSAWRGKKIADVGCNNGYYMYRMLAQQPALVIGFDPVPRYWYMFHSLQQIAQEPKLHFEMLGAEHLGLYPKFFDVVFCLGILYHHPNPLLLLKQIWESLTPKGELIIDCAGIPGEESIALFPQKRYAKVPGTWFVPTKTCLINWLRRSRFDQIEVFYAQKLSIEEQRSTEWAPYESLEDFLDPNNEELTVEGYPAPHRFYLKARKLAG